MLSEDVMTVLSPRSIETLIDLVEIKLSCLDVMDREDRQEQKVLQRSLAELQEFRRATTSPAHRGVSSGIHRAAPELAAV